MAGLLLREGSRRGKTRLHRVLARRRRIVSVARIVFVLAYHGGVGPHTGMATMIALISMRNKAGKKPLQVAEEAGGRGAAGVVEMLEVRSCLRPQSTRLPEHSMPEQPPVLYSAPLLQSDAFALTV